MSTFTKEQLIARINQVTAINKYRISRDPDADGLAMDNELFAIALASLEAEAVGEVVLGEYDDCGCHPDARVECIAADGQADWENFKDGTRLYAAPPSMVVIDERAAFNAWNNDENLPIAGVGAKNAAWLAWQARAKLAAPPAPVSMKDHQIRELVNELRDIAVEYHGTQQLRERIARTIRAAMLQGADGNSPVIQDGWVACSERMPECEVDVQVYCAEKKEQMVAYLERNEGEGLFRFATWRTGDGIYCQPTHWMPLPAAPQQEAKNV